MFDNHEIPLHKSGYDNTHELDIHTNLHTSLLNTRIHIRDQIHFTFPCYNTLQVRKTALLPATTILLEMRHIT